MPYMIQLTVDNSRLDSIVQYLTREKRVKNITTLPTSMIRGNGVGSIDMSDNSQSHHPNNNKSGSPSSSSSGSQSLQHQQQTSVIMFRCRDERLTELVTDLSEVKGVGIDYGVIDVTSLIATRPHLAGQPEEEAENAKRSSKFAKRRLLTEYVYGQVMNQSKLTLDFLLFCLIGAILAGVGLATDNAVTIVASMLVSPLMGPILGLTLGTIVRSRTLIIKSIKSELAGCSLALLTGVVMGIILSPFGGPYALGFPTFQMLDRGTVEGIIFGVVIAFVSGIGVSLAVSHGSINSLVGVAISAALLPPITNTGMLFTYALFSLMVPQLKIYSDLRHPENVVTYTTRDYFKISGISFCIFILNFVLIYCTGLVIFKLKEFAPMKLKQQSQGWSDFKSAIDTEEKKADAFPSHGEEPSEMIIREISQPRGVGQHTDRDVDQQQHPIADRTSLIQLDGKTGKRNGKRKKRLSGDLSRLFGKNSRFLRKKQTLTKSYSQPTSLATMDSMFDDEDDDQENCYASPETSYSDDIGVGVSRDYNNRNYHFPTVVDLPANKVHFTTSEKSELQ